MHRRNRSEGVSRELQLPGNPREPGLRDVAGKATWTTGQVNARCIAFFFEFEKMTVDEHDITNMIAEIKRRVGVYAKRYESGSLSRSID